MLGLCCWMHYVYILWSKRLGRYYVGETEDPIQRLRQHNEHLSKDASTAVTNDWQMLCSIM